MPVYNTSQDIGGSGIISNNNNLHSRQINSLKPIAGKGIKIQRTGYGVIISATGITTVSGSTTTSEGGTPRWR